ncbi:MAG: type I polyketide synthase, partial [Pseudomonadota bacterium]
MTTSTTNQEVLKALREARTKLEQAQQKQHEPVAVIGMAGRFPGAENIASFWEMLINKKSGVRMLSEAELAASGIDVNTTGQDNYVPAWSSFDSPEKFDARFFGYSPREATLLDPQHRVFLECAWHAMEDAGYDSSRYDEPIGVFAGSALNRYLINLFNHPELRKTTDNVQAVVSNVMGLMPTRVSYHLDLKGPSVGIQTGCSTSLVAVHEAYLSLLANDCTMALAGGVTVNEVKPQGYHYQEGSIASPNGKTCSFDAQGKGTVFGNGVGIVVLKKLSKALSEGDRILAVIRGSAINNDGADKVGLIAPSVNGQAKVIASALKDAGVDPATISYIEAHGTGTEMGDPIEFSALRQTLNQPLSQAQKTCAIGSVKSNFGHLDAAAGIAGLIKSVLCLQNKILPGSLNYDTPNPKMNLEESCFNVQQETLPWNNQSTSDNAIPLRAGVSSFGMGGTNAHVILEQSDIPLTAQSDLPARPWQLLPFSAKTDSALKQIETQLNHRVEVAESGELPSMAFTLQHGRRQLDKRRSLLVNEQGRCEPINIGHAVSTTAPHNIVFLFSGQGCQFPGMCADIYQTEPRFKYYFDQCAEILNSIDPELSLHDIIFSDPLNKQARKQLQQTAFAQPAIFSVEYAMAKLFEEWGIRPDVMIGHSIGEYVAACMAGVFTLEQGLELVYQRGRLMQSCATGSMLAIMMNETDTQNWLTENRYTTGWDIAAINADIQTVISGDTETISKILGHMEEAGLAARLVPTSHAFHSHMMEPIVDKFHRIIDQLSLSEPVTDIYSNLTGKLLTAEEAKDANYWTQHLRNTVRFHEAAHNLVSHSPDTCVFVEVGPGNTLSTLLPASFESIETLSGKNKSQADSEILTRALGKLWQAGVAIDWKTYNEGRPQQRTSMPVYPFEREPYWVDLHQSMQPATDSMIDSDNHQPFIYSPQWVLHERNPHRDAFEHIQLFAGFKQEALANIAGFQSETNNIKTVQHIDDDIFSES